MPDRADWRAVLICKKYILIIIILAVVFLPQCFVYASDTEITDKIEQQMLEKIDMSEIEKYSKDYLPDRLSFSDIVDAILAGDQKAGEKICEYIYELFFYEIAAVRPVIINVLCYTCLFYTSPSPPDRRKTSMPPSAFKKKKTNAKKTHETVEHNGQTECQHLDVSDERDE